MGGLNFTILEFLGTGASGTSNGNGFDSLLVFKVLGAGIHNTGNYIGPVHTNGTRNEIGPVNGNGTRHGNDTASDPLLGVPSSVIRNVYLTHTLEWVYQIFMIAIVLGFSIRHAWRLYSWKCAGKVRERGRFSYEDQGRSNGRPPSDNDCRSNGLHEDDQQSGENQPLISKEKSSRPSIITKSRAWSIRPGPRLPLLGQTCSSNAQFFLFTLFFAVNIIFLFLGYILSISTIWALGFRAGGLIIANLPWLYLLSAKSQPLTFLTGYSYESFNICHRALGHFICILALCHMVCMIAGFAAIGQGLGFSLAQFLRIKIFVMGEVAFGCYFVLYIFSLPVVRRKVYELFLGFHVTLQLAALCLLYWHHPRAKAPVLISLFIFLVDRVVFRLWLKSETVEASIAVSTIEGDCFLQASIPSRQKRSWFSGFKFSVANGWYPGQHAFISIPEMGLRYILQAHPFSIASLSPGFNKLDPQHKLEADEDAELQMLIRAHNGFSRDLISSCRARDCRIRLSVTGPYGSQHTVHRLLAADTCLFIAGGTGIAVISPFLQATINMRGQDHASHALIWIVRNELHRSWVPGQVATSLASKNLRLVTPPATAAHGRPSLNALVEETLYDHSLPSSQSLKPRRKTVAHKICVMVSGPDAMVSDTRDICSQLLVRGFDVDLLVEKFGY